MKPLLIELDGAVLEVEVWPDDFFRRIVELQQDADFRHLDDSWMLLHFVCNNWEQLSSDQRRELRDVLISGFDKYQNWMGAFVTSEILGERYADKLSLEVLTDLGRRASLPARAAVPHGLETLAMTTPLESLRTLAVERLQEMTKNQSEQVRNEALTSLRKLGS